MEQNEFIFTIARMNPPTIGHKYLIRQMVDHALANGTDKVHVILSHSVDEKNPMPCHEKKEIVRQMVADIAGNVAVNIVCMETKYPLPPGERSTPTPDAVGKAIGNDRYGKATMFIGDDRKNSYNWIPDFLRTNFGIEKVNLVALNRTINPISATKIREIISKSKGIEEFREAYQGSGLSDGILTDLFNKLNTYMGMDPEEDEPSFKKLKHAGGKTITRRRKTPKRKTRRKTKRNSSNKRNKSFR